MKITYAPTDYQCPFCKIAKRKDFGSIYTKEQDIFYQDQNITAFIGSHFWPHNKGNVIIIPNQHSENIYEIPDELLSKIVLFSKRVAVAMKEIYKCDGVSTRQHNEPSGDQDVWHFHYHILPRYKNDNLYILTNEKKLAPEEERREFAERLRKYFEIESHN